MDESGILLNRNRIYQDLELKGFCKRFKNESNDELTWRKELVN
jgi:hypothetical protein